MPKTTRESYKMGLVFTATAVLFSEFWDWFTYVAFPNRSQAISAPAMYFANPPQSIGMSEIWMIVFFPIFILGPALFVGWLINWLGEQTHTGPGAAWRWMVLGLVFSFTEFSDTVPNFSLLVWGFVLGGYWLLFRKFGLSCFPATT